LVVQPDQGLSKETDDVNYGLRLSPEHAGRSLGWTRKQESAENQKLDHNWA